MTNAIPEYPVFRYMPIPGILRLYINAQHYRPIDAAPPQWRALGFRPVDVAHIQRYAQRSMRFTSAQYLNFLRLFSNTRRAIPHSAREHLRELGHLVSDARQDGGWDSVVDQINAYDLGRYIADGDVNTYLTDAGFASCDDCGEWFNRDDGISTRDGRVGQCCADDYVFCVDSDQYVPEDEAYCVVISRHGDTEFREFDEGIAELPYWHSWGEYFDTDIASEIGLYWSEYSDGWVDEETYYEENREEDDIAEYHSHYLRRGHGYFHEDSTRNDPAVGLELEIDQDGDILEGLARNGLSWIVERDSSLDSDTGVEIVSPPITLPQWRETMPALHNALRYCNASGYNASGDYGIHLSVHRRHLSPLQEARLMMFFAFQGNAKFIDVIAQRNGIYSGARSDRAKSRCTASALYPRYGDKKPHNTDKMAALHLKATHDIAECRIFRSNVRPERIMKNIEFLHAWALDNAKVYPVLSEYLASPDGWAIKGVGRVDRGYLGV